MNERRNLFARLSALCSALGWALMSGAEHAPLAELTAAVNHAEQSCSRRRLAVA